MGAAALTPSPVLAAGCGGGNGNRFSRKIRDLRAKSCNGKTLNAFTATIKKHDIVAVLGLFVLVGRGLVDVAPLGGHLLQRFENKPRVVAVEFELIAIFSVSSHSETKKWPGLAASG